MTVVRHPPAVARASRAADVTAVAVLLGLAALAWLRTVDGARAMSDTGLGLATVGTAGPGTVATGTFLVMWVVMTAAMMFPAVVPMVLVHRRIVSRRGGGAWPTVAFVAGYLLVWTAAGVVPLGVLVSVHHLAAAAGSGPVTVAAGLTLALAGAYQFTDWKRRCLRSCRSPLGFVLTHDLGGGVRGAARAGAQHGAFCLGCCWALMAVLLVVGVMNLVWMAVLTVVIVAERSWRHGPALLRLVGGGLVALGAAVVASPATFPAFLGIVPA